MRDYFIINSGSITKTIPDSNGRIWYNPKLNKTVIDDPVYTIEEKSNLYKIF